ncbi:trypsin-3-like [Tenebrio molitor]|uniref:trypsin-3-like n=1 Tax=Tenebrio molitor TaxID=7067 RepID=UPI003624AA58
MKPTLFSLFFFSNVFLISAGPQCGRSEKEEKIVGGNEVGYYKYSWIATLRLQNNPKQLVCGGSLIGPKTVLTAAHCYKPFFKSVADGETTFEDIYLIYLGGYNMCISEENTQIFTAEKVIIHEKYMDGDGSNYYDIALLILEDTAEDFTPICLPEAGQTLPSDGTAVGFGKESSSAWKLPCTMREVQLKIYSDEECRDMLEKNGESGDKLANAFCAGDLEGTKDTCQGDDGGPFQTRDEDGNYIVTGITSFGFGCGNKYTLGMYTYVANYTE